MDWAERRCFNSSDPSETGLAAMAVALAGHGAHVIAVQRLGGGLAAATHAVQLDSGQWVVLKRAPSEGRRGLELEYTRLQAARRSPVDTPEPLGIDGEGEWFGHAALVMSRLPGRTIHFHPVTGPRWIKSLAETLTRIHSTPIDDDMAQILGAGHAGVSWEPAPPEEIQRTGTLERLIEAGLALRHRPSIAPDVLLHHDFHRGNVLWNDGAVSGVLDWNEACIGPAACDVAYCSVDLAMTHGLDIGLRFVRLYEAASGSVDDLYRWQCLWTANAMRWAESWITEFTGDDNELTVELAQQRLHQLANHLASR